MKPSNAANDNLIDRTIETWQPRLDRSLSREDARQIVENVTGFFSILAEWSWWSRLTRLTTRAIPTCPAAMARCAMTAEIIAKVLSGSAGQS